MTELVLSDERLREAAAIAHRIAKSDTAITDKTPAIELGTLLLTAVGKSVEKFLQLDESFRNKLRDAALFVNQRLDSDDKLFGFLRSAFGNLKKCAKGTVDASNFAKIAVFLTALVSVEEATTLKMSLHIS